jgi:predicted nucleic acid-binding protein
VDIVIVDTSVFIDHLRTGCHQQRIDSLAGVIRSSAVVLAELRRGATRPAEQKFVRALERNHPILTPTERNWIDSGTILGRIYKQRGFTPEKLRDLHFDVLIALTASSYEARVITSNGEDFEMIKRYRPFRLEVWPSGR